MLIVFAVILVGIYIGIPEGSITKNYKLDAQ